MIAPPTDDDLISRALAGDDEACTALVRRHQDYVFGVALIELGDRTLAREVVQDVFVRAFQRLVGFRREAAFTTWLYRMTLNRCRDVQRAQAAQRRFTPLDTATDRAMTSHDSPHALIERSQIDARVRRAVASLPENLRRPVVLRYAAGLEYKAIADVLRLPLGTVCSRLQRAVRLLGDALGKES